MSPVSILLIEDHAMFRTGLSMVLRSAITGVQVLEAGSLEEALRYGIDAPDVLLLDIQLPGLNGLEGIVPLRRKWPQAAIVMLSADAAPKTVQVALGRGVEAFVSKTETPDNMLAIVKRVLLKEPIATPHMTTGLSSASPLLTPRQCEVLDLLCKGMSNKAIGRRLGLSENTVRGHVQAVLAALRVTSRSEAAYAARQKGLVG